MKAKASFSFSVPLSAFLFLNQCKLIHFEEGACTVDLAEMAYFFSKVFSTVVTPCSGKVSIHTSTTPFML